MRILVACEESQAVTLELRKLGHEAYSCDILPCSGGYPAWHLQKDLKEVLKEKWDIIIAFPPCTYLTVTGNRWFNIERYGDKAVKRHEDRKLAIEFFMLIANADCDRIAIENPIGVMSSHWRKPDQIIQPYQFGHTARKSTCLWLKNLPRLTPTEIVEPKLITLSNGKTFLEDYMKGVKRSKVGESSSARSKTYRGIAKAMANQWTSNL